MLVCRARITRVCWLCTSSKWCTCRDSVRYSLACDSELQALGTHPGSRAGVLKGLAQLLALLVLGSLLAVEERLLGLQETPQQVSNQLQAAIWTCSQADDKHSPRSTSGARS